MEVFIIVIKYYPDYDENNNENRIKNDIEKNLKKNDFQLWKKVIHTMNKYKRMSEDEFVQEIMINLNLADDSKKIKLLTKKNMRIYEFRIPPVRTKGVLRIYFKYYQKYIFILDSEIKTDDPKKIDSAFDRYKILKKNMKGVI